MHAYNLTLKIRRAGAGFVAAMELQLPAQIVDEAGTYSAAFVVDRAALLAASLDPDEYGRLLSAMFFSDPIFASTFGAARDRALREHLPLRVRLQFDDSAVELEGLRWETLRDPVSGAPLALDGRLLLSRYMESERAAPISLPAYPDLHALVLIASPRDLPHYKLAPIDVVATMEHIRAALGDVPTTWILGGAAGSYATPTALIDALRQFGVAPSLVCLICHGSLVDDEAYLWLEDERGNVQRLSGSELAAVIERLPVRPLAALIAACQSAGSSDEARLLGALGPRLAFAGIPAVIAMRDAVTFATIHELLPRLVQELRRDGVVDRALAIARGGISGGKWWMPVLWQRLPDGRLWRERGTATAATPADPTTAWALFRTLPVATLPPIGPLPAHYLMPFARNPLFVGREAELRRLAMALKERAMGAVGHIVAATGLGGVGKTNLATEFVHRYGRFFAGGVFWISCTSPDAVAQDVIAAGQALGLPGFDNLDYADKLRRVRQAWQEDLPRLLVFDNCEDEALLDEWRPTSGGCKVLVTSRRSFWSAALAVSTVQLGVLNRVESVVLLQKFRAELSAQEATAIAATLGDLPLALHLAGSFLKRYRTISGDDYLKQVANALTAHPSLLGRGAEQSGTRHVLHVARTFALSLNQLQPDDETDQVARELLACAACLAPGEPIPHELVLALLVQPHQGADDLLRAEDALARLGELGLIEQEASGSNTIHGLVADFVRRAFDTAPAQLQVERTLFDMAGAGIDRLEQVRISAHLERHFVHSARVALVRNDELAANLANGAGLCLGRRGDLAGAEFFHRQGLAIRTTTLGPEHPLTVTSMNNLATIRQEQGALQEAAALYEQALQLVQRRPESFDGRLVGKLLNNDGYLALVQGRYADAERLLYQALDVIEQCYGDNHPQLAVPLLNVSNLLLAQGRVQQALGILEVLLPAAEEELDGDQHYTSLIRISLARALTDQGAFDRAQALIEQGIAAVEGALGGDHPTLVQLLNNLGHHYRIRGAFVEAQRCFERSLNIARATFGEEHHEAGTVLNNLAALALAQDRFDDALAYLTPGLAVLQRTVGSEHQLTLAALGNLASLHDKQGRIEEAYEIYLHVYRLSHQVLGEAHPDTARAANNLGFILRAKSQYQEAERYFREAIHINQQAFGPEHPSVGIGLGNLSSILRYLGRHDEALEHALQALTIIKHAHGPAHVDVPLALNWVGLAYAALDQPERARPHLEQALAMNTELLGFEHTEVITTLSNLADVLNALGLTEQAIEMHMRTLELRERLFGPLHVSLVESLLPIANHYLLAERFVEAEAAASRAITICNNAYGPASPGLALFYLIVGVAAKTQDRYTEAIANLKQSLIMFERDLGSEHTLTVDVRGILDEIEAQAPQDDSELGCDDIR